MSNNDVIPENDQPQLTVGQLLQQEREQRGYTLEQVARQLKLKIELLRSIEADQPDKEILPTFMRGYLRAYARFLKIPEQQLLSRFEQTHQVQSAPVKSMKTFSNRQAKQQTEKRFMWATYLIGAILLVLLAIWLWQNARDFDGFNGFNNAEPAVTTPVTVTSAPTTVSSTLPATTDMPEPQTDVITEPVISNEASTAPVVAATSPVNDTVPAANAADESAESSAAVSAEADVFREVNNSGLDKLKMTFTDSCWIDVVDSNGERIAYGTKQAGYVMELNAKGPFTITLGNPGVVSIDINQQAFDLSPFPGGRVAKFTLAGKSE